MHRSHVYLFSTDTILNEASPQWFHRGGDNEMKLNHHQSVIIIVCAQ